MVIYVTVDLIGIIMIGLCLFVLGCCLGIWGAYRYWGYYHL